MSRCSKLAAVALLTATCGCSSLAENFDAINPFGPSYVTADTRNPAVEVACVWQPGEGRNSQGLPARGFSGQIYFFTRRDAEPVLVDGSVRVYLFTDHGTPDENSKPIRQFDYEPEAWAVHANMTSLGPAYSVFIPYPVVEPYQVRCQLRVRFTPQTGPPIWSESITMTLDGPPRPGNEPLSWSSPEAQDLKNVTNQMSVARTRGTPAQLEGRESATADPARRLRTDTIPLGALQQIVYEVPSPAAKTETTRRPAESAESTRSVVPLGQALAGLNLEEALEVSHPLGADSKPVRGRAHPLLGHPAAAEQVPSNASSDQMPSDHPLSKVAPLAEAIPFRSNGLRPSYPNLSSRRLRSSLDQPRNHSMATTAPRFDLRSSDQEAGQETSRPTAIQSTSFGPPTGRSGKGSPAPLLGQWQSLDE